MLLFAFSPNPVSRRTNCRQNEIRRMSSYHSREGYFAEYYTQLVSARALGDSLCLQQWGPSPFRHCPCSQATWTRSRHYSYFAWQPPKTMRVDNFVARVRLFLVANLDSIRTIGVRLGQISKSDLRTASPLEWFRAWFASCPPDIDKLDSVLDSVGWVCRSAYCPDGSLSFVPCYKSHPRAVDLCTRRRTQR